MRAREAISCCPASALAIASDSRSQNCDMRGSASAGSASGLVVDAATAPHTRPPTVIGVVTAERMPSPRTSAASSPGTPL